MRDNPSLIYHIDIDDTFGQKNISYRYQGQKYINKFHLSNTPF